MSQNITNRLNHARDVAIDAGKTALDYFGKLDSLNIQAKGHQDMVTQADQNVETQIRQALAAQYPDDGIVGEEHAPVSGNSGFTWVIDPIDGTANFVAGIPAWVVVIALVNDAKTVAGVIHDPNHDNTYCARTGSGALCNDAPIRVSKSDTLGNGTVGIGFSNRSPDGTITRLVDGVVSQGGLFQRNASGALSLAYVAAGNYIGYAEDHMNAWDCLAGQLLVQEAGGVIEQQDADQMITQGGRVIAGAPGIFDQLKQVCDRAFDS